MNIPLEIPDNLSARVAKAVEKKLGRQPNETDTELLTRAAALYLENTTKEVEIAAAVETVVVNNAAVAEEVVVVENQATNTVNAEIDFAPKPEVTQPL